MIKKCYLCSQNLNAMTKPHSKMLNNIKDIFLSLYYTFFPKKCLLCSNVLSENEDMICTKCKKLYPYPKSENNMEYFAPLMPYAEDIFVMSWYTYTGNAIKDFKFRENFYMGRCLSDMLADGLSKEKWIKEIDYIVPVPLHKQKQKKRGFNQCEYIADFIGKRLDIGVNSNNLFRKINTKSQHLSSNQERYENMKDSFDLRDISLFNNKTILLVDDVITTCSTTMECCKALKQCESIKIYVCALASDRNII